MSKVYLKDVRKAVKETVRIVTYMELWRAYLRSPVHEMGIGFRDREYKIMPVETWELYLEWSDVDKLIYVSEFGDCDDFADILNGECKRKLKVNGIAVVDDYNEHTPHSYICIGCYEPDGTVSVKKIEPQNDRLIINHTGMYEGKSGYIRF